MQSTVNPEETDPHDIFVIEPDVVLAARVDQPLQQPVQERPAPAEKPPQDKATVGPVEDIMGDILSRPSTPKLRVVPEISVAAPATKPAQPVKPTRPADTSFRATAATADAIASEIKIPSDRLNGAKPSRGAWARRAAVGFLFALGSVAAAQAWDRYGDTAREMLAQWTPALALPSSQPSATAPATATAAAQPAPSAAEAAVTDQTPAPPAPAALQPAAATPAAAPDQAQQLQSMTQDLAAMGQQIEALKATIAQLKAGQDQMAQQLQRDVAKNTVARNAEAKASETRPEARTSEHPRILGAPPRPLGPPIRRSPHDAYAPPPTSAAMNLPPQPYPSRPPSYAAPAPMPPVDTEAPDGGPVVRPPMPLH